VSGLGLLAIATLIVDLVGLRLFPQTSSLYRQYKYEETPEDSKMNSFNFNFIVVVADFLFFLF